MDNSAARKNPTNGEDMAMRHWDLRRDPFLDDGPYVPLPDHEEAVARLIHAIEAPQGPVLFTAGAGLGKTKALRRAIAESRSARRRVALASHPLDGLALWNELADRLGADPEPARDRAAAWRALERAAKVRSLQGQRVVFAIDGAENLLDESHWPDIERLALIDGGNDARPALILTARADAAFDAPPLWSPSIKLAPLTRSETARYLAAKLNGAGGSDNLFTPRAVVRLHAASRGVPRGLDRLASLSLRAAAARGLEVVASEVVDVAVQECRVPWV